MNHQEPICFRGKEISYEEAIEVYRILRQILEWIDPMLNEYSLEFAIKGNMIEKNQCFIDE
jgi:hypothetical protein